MTTDDDAVPDEAVPDDAVLDDMSQGDVVAEDPPVAAPPAPVVVFDGADRDVRRDAAASYRERLIAAVDELLGDRLLAATVGRDGARPDVYRDGIVLDAFDVAARCPRRLVAPSGDTYRDSVRNGRRRVGLVALRHLVEEGGTPADAVRAALADRSGWPVGLARWYEELDRGGRVALAAGATTWVVGARRLVGTGPGTRWRPPFPKPAWTLPGRLVRLTAAVDATAGSAPVGERLLVLSDRAPSADDRLRAAFVAFVWAVGSGRVPVRVALGSPATGRMQRTTVDSALLDLALDRTVELLGYRADPSTAPAVPGRACRSCEVLEDCPEGLARVAGVQASAVELPSADGAEPTM